MLQHRAYRRAIQASLGQGHIPELPVDLYRPILEHLRGEWHALRNLALVNRNMYAEAMLLLYERIHITSGKNITALVTSLRANPDASKRIRSLSLDIDVALGGDAHAALFELLQGLTELAELRVSWRAHKVSREANIYGAILDACPATKLTAFTWDAMYSTHVQNFVLRQDGLQELEVTDWLNVLGRHEAIPGGTLPHLQRVIGDARWIVGAAPRRPIKSVKLTRTTPATTLGAYFRNHRVPDPRATGLTVLSELLRVLSNSNGPCTKFLSSTTSATCGLNPADVLDVAHWLPNLVELGDCYIYDPHTMAFDLLVRTMESFTSLKTLRLVDNSDWMGGKFSLQDAVRFHRAVPTLERIEVVPMNLKGARTFVRHAREVHAGRTVLYEYRWMEERDPRQVQQKRHAYRASLGLQRM
ncbi:hypothetical protein AURDEDRAFT_157467 [Auricularia subglabra TFB-10046 SS5]|nr:hypothetical protein AURDEDRAFT_157467 [Auricularia subglabra TFB-10046 SS5]